MLSLHSAYILLLIVSFSSVVFQLQVKRKTQAHIFFALFCGSICMVAIKFLSASAIGPYQYIVGAGTCLTCNGIWLVARALFSSTTSISTRHIAYASAIAILVISNQMIAFFLELEVVHFHQIAGVRKALDEITNLLSSTVLLLTFWEAAKGFNQKSRRQKLQRVLFITVFSSGLFACSVAASAFYSTNELPDVFPWFVVVSALSIVIATQIVLLMQAHDEKTPTQTQQNINDNTLCKSNQAPSTPIDPAFIDKLELRLIEQKAYLTPNLKMIDLANQLGVSEYKVSRAIRTHFNALNFNSFINELRIQHAQTLLETEQYKSWSILVVSMESGFASLPSFNRVFKAQCKCSPNLYRKQFLNSP